MLAFRLSQREPTMANLLLRQSFKSPSVYEVAIKVKDKKWLLELLTYETVEASVQKRVEMKARTYSQVKRAVEFRTAGSLVCQEIELQIDVVIGGCDKHTLKLPSELGYGSSVACCGEGSNIGSPFEVRRSS
ncbi:chorismate mutase [Trifolium repens]|nr:chorismate mutase [Trifolium repens]